MKKWFMVVLVSLALVAPALAATAVPVPGKPGWYTNPETPEEAAARIHLMEMDVSGG